MTSRTTVVVFKLVSDALQHGGLAVARSLGRMGVPVHVAYRDRGSAASRSRFVTGRSHVPAGDDSAILSLLRRVAQRAGSVPILLPLDDVASTFVDRHADVLRESFRFPSQPSGLPLRLADKRQLHELCLAAGVPVPEARFPQSRDEFVRGADELGYPIVVKSIDPAIMRMRPAASSVSLAADPGAALRIYDTAEIPVQPNLMLQQFIPGEAQSVWMFNGYVAEDGRCTFGVTGQKIRQAPPDTGATSLGVASINDAVGNHARRFLAAVGYRGIVDMGFRYDARDGSYRLLDVNPRIGSSFRLFTDTAGNDVVRALYADFVGEPVVPASMHADRRWLVENQDAATALKLMRDQRLSPAAWIRSLRDVEELAWWSLDDPRPFAAMLVGTASDVWSSLTRRRSAPGR